MHSKRDALLVFGESCLNRAATRTVLGACTMLGPQYCRQRWVCSKKNARTVLCTWTTVTTEVGAAAWLRACAGESTGAALKLCASCGRPTRDTALNTGAAPGMQKGKERQPVRQLLAAQVQEVKGLQPKHTPRRRLVASPSRVMCCIAENSCRSMPLHAYAATGSRQRDT